MRIPQVLRDGVAFLYRTKEEAKSHAKIGGTAFIVGHPILYPDGKPTSYWVPYLVTNRHVAGMCPVIRVNRRDGEKPDVIEKEERDWVMHPTDNVAVTPVIGQINPIIHKISFGYTEVMIAEQRAKDWEIGVGDEVFMIGRFVNHQGREENSAAVRFGCISVMPEPMYNRAILRDQLSYAVEMRSRTGFSGSLVVAYRTIATVLDRVKTDHFSGILGVNWGYVLDEETGENTWLNGVVPAWKIMEVFEIPQLKEIHRQATEYMLAEIKKGNAAATPAIAMPVKSVSSEAENLEADEQSRERFTALLGAATKKRPQAD